MVYGKKLAKMKSIKQRKIQLVASFKLLNVWLNECMSFKEHVQHIAAKMISKIGVISRAKEIFKS